MNRPGSWGRMANGTPKLDDFLSALQNTLKQRNGEQLRWLLQVEPPLLPDYLAMIGELRQNYPAGKDSDDKLTARCETLVPGTSNGRTWTAFPTFIRAYLMFLRDHDTNKLFEMYDLFKKLLIQCIVALGDGQHGVIMLPVSLYYCRVLAKLSIGLEARPDLTANHLDEEDGTEEATERSTLVEKSANVVREAFIKCLTDRSGAPGKQGKPEGKKSGVYSAANLCLKLLYKCGKLRNAEQMFASINSQSPPLALYPASQRVTYLYYLGIFLFSNNLFFPALLAFEESYRQCHRQALKQRHMILAYLITCNITLGRFPSSTLLERPEAQGLSERFIPICRAIRNGDFITFHKLLAVGAPETAWFSRKGILLALRNRCEILVWRSLARKVFIIGGFHGAATTNGQRGPPPYLYIHKVDTAVRLLESLNPTSVASDKKVRSTLSLPGLWMGDDAGLVPMQMDAEYSGKNGVIVSNHQQPEADDYFCPEGFFNATGNYVANESRKRIRGGGSDTANGNSNGMSLPSGSRSWNPAKRVRVLENQETKDPNKPSARTREIECILASLIDQKLMRGYLTHNNPRYAIPGSRAKGVLPTGFPNVWQTILARENEDRYIPGWVREAAPTAAGKTGSAARPAAGPPGGGGGRVVNLSGARPVGQAGGGGRVVNLSGVKPIGH